MQICAEAYWRPELGVIFEEPDFNIRVVEHPFHTQRGGEFLGLLTSVEDGKPKVAGQACCSDLVSALYLELSPGVVKPLG